MAKYRRRTARSGANRRSARSGSYRGRSGYRTARAGGSRRVSSGRGARRSVRSARAGQTLRIVIDQAPAPTVMSMPQRNEAGQLVKAAPVRKARF